MGLRATKPGESVLDLLWQQLDELMRNLMLDQVDDVDYTRGCATQLAECIALITNPTAPDLEAVRVEARARYDDAVGDDEPAPPTR